MNRTDYLKNNIKSDLILICFIAFMLFIFAPFEMYLSNKGAFFYSGTELIAIAALFFFACFICGTIGILIIGLVCPGIHKWVKSFIFGISIGLYIQGNYLKNNYGELDGKEIDWSLYRGEGIASLCVFIVPILVSIIALILIKQTNYNKTVCIVSVCLILVQLVTLSTLMIQSGGLKKDSVYKSTLAGQMDFSKNDNLIVLMLDSYDATILKEILSEDSAGTYYDYLEDFVFYPDTVGRYISTFYSVPYIISGVDYRNDITNSEHWTKTYEQSPLLNKLTAKSWATEIYNANKLPDDDIAMVADNCEKIDLTVSSHRRLAAYIYKLVGFRYSPQPLKKYFWFYAEDIAGTLMDNEQDVDLFTGNNLEFYSDIDDMTVTKDISDFKFYTLHGAHVPYHLDENLVEHEEETDVYQTDKGCLEIVKKFVDAMKQNEIYDNSTIVVLADHGTIKNYNPLFMIKYKNAHHPLTVDDTPFSYSTLQELFTAIIDGGEEKACETVIQSHSVEPRYFYCYYHDRDDILDEYCQDIIEYTVGNTVSMENSLEATGVTYSYKQTE